MNITDPETRAHQIRSKAHNVDFLENVFNDIYHIYVTYGDHCHKQNCTGSILKKIIVRTLEAQSEISILFKSASLAAILRYSALSNGVPSSN
jgi:hypothetical protein